MHLELDAHQVQAKICVGCLTIIHMRQLAFQSILGLIPLTVNHDFMGKYFHIYFIKHSRVHGELKNKGEGNELRTLQAKTVGIPSITFPA